MDKKEELNFLISEGEGYNLEFKENFSDSMSKDICAFANANGGKILLGITDKGEVKGLNITNKLKSQVQDLVRKFEPHLDISLKESGNALIVEVPEGENKPYSINGLFYLRYGPNSQQLGRDEIKEFFQKEGHILFDEKPNLDFNMENDFDEKKFKNFLIKAKISPILKRNEILENLSLLKENHIKNAGVLLFCYRITKFFNGSITCVLYQGKDKYKILDKKEFDADLYSNFDNTFLYIISHLNTEYFIKEGPREEKLELPEEALREAILNAIAHRNYLSNASILIEIFSDRVEMTNPGGLVKGITKSDLGKRSLSRNNLLFGLMQRMGLVEKVGSGIARIRKSMKEYRLKLKFDISEDWFSIIFQRKKEKKTVEKTVEKIIHFIRENPTITQEELATKTGLTRRGIEWNIEKLKKEGKLKRIGPAKGGYWEVLR